ncbi:MAG TPA: acyl-ACP--UDP-N-acetylglucosamine O-acyltransferase [bacterium]|jgi:UDP-N-acetylglucosamine acyltransferase
MAIHPRTEIDSTAKIADDAEIGPGVVIGRNASIESGVELGPNVIIGPNTTIKKGARIFPGAIIGTEPQDYKYDGAETICEVGEESVIREYCTINRGTKASGATIIGSRVFLMSYTHIAHDCRVGNHVVMASGVAMGGHCTIEDYATLGGGAGLHQFLRVGTYAMVGGFAGMRKDAPPYMLTAGSPPAKVHGLNTIGLKRAGIPIETRQLIRQAYRILYRSGINFHDGLSKIERDLDRTPEIEHIIEFFKTSKRGVSTGVKGFLLRGEEEKDESDSNAVEV